MLTSCFCETKCKGKSKLNCNTGCVKRGILTNLLTLSNLPKHLWEDKPLVCGSDKDEYMRLQYIEDNVYDFVKNGKNIFIYSDHCGNGKTSWAVRLLLAYLDSIWHISGFNRKALFVSVPTFLYDCKRNISHPLDGFQQLCDDLNTVDLVVWDDICAGNLTGYEHQILMQSIDTRMNSGLSNIFTANTSVQNVKKELGERLASRVWGCSYTVEFKDEDKRGLKNGRITDIKSYLERKNGFNTTDK